MIRSTKHYFNDVNSGKVNIINNFLKEYRIATQFYIDYIWNNVLCDQNNKICFDIKNDLLNIPKFLNYKLISFKTDLSARALSASLNQALGIVKGGVSEKRKLLWVISKRKEENKSTSYYENKLSKLTLTKPILKDNFNAELSSKNIEIRYNKNHFDCFVKLSSTGFDVIKIPIKFHKQDKKWLGKSGKLLNGVLIGTNNIQLRFEIPDVELKITGKVVGGDTGLKSVITLSDRQTPNQTDNHGHSLNSILDRLARKKKGSKGFKRTQDQRKNFINWSINQLNLTDIKQINLEEVVNINYGRNTSRKMSGWTNAIIESKVLSRCEELGVQVLLQKSEYRSQRCSSCSYVLKSNRNKKEYKCKSCGFVCDADLNAALNHEVELFKLPFGFRQLKLNMKPGFFWKSDGIFDKTGKEIRVPCANKL